MNRSAGCWLLLACAVWGVGGTGARGADAAAASDLPGWAERSVASDTQVVADVWSPAPTQTVARFTWRGSFRGWTSTNLPPVRPDSFRAAVWRHGADTNHAFPHPGTVIWSAELSGWTAVHEGWTRDPRRPGAPREAVFRFQADLPPERRYDPSVQATSPVWWVSIVAAYTADVPAQAFGWLVRPSAGKAAPGSALRVASPSNPMPGDSFLQGEPIHASGTSTCQAVLGAEAPSALPRGDLGDAPDMRANPAVAISVYGAGFGTAYFPSHFAAGAEPTGPRHLQPRSGLFLGAAVSLEEAARAGSDDDGANNLDPAADKADGDGGDDGLVGPVEFSTHGQSSIRYVLTSTNRGEVGGFLNVWVDWNRDGDWDDQIAEGSASIGEWAVKNLPVSLPAAGSITSATPPFLSWLPAQAEHRAMWLRLSVAEAPAPAAGGGRGPGAGYRSGETEDYKLEDYVEVDQDFGDAPEGYPAAHHRVVSGLHLGAGVDCEASSAVSAEAAGDDRQGSDDEDGVVFPEVMAAGTTVTCTVQAASAGYLGAWFDWNRDGDWMDEGERIASGMDVAAGATPLAVAVPAGQRPGPVFARFRLGSNRMEMCEASGPAVDGEVEDYRLTIVTLDWGDAPGPYGVTREQGGACHVIVMGVGLGTPPDAEMDALPNGEAEGDDKDGTDDEDGLSFGTWTAGSAATVQVSAAVSGYISLWVDWDANMKWEGALENVVSLRPIPEGVSVITFPVPAGTRTGLLGFRARFSTRPDGVRSPEGMALDGEVEDYLAPVIAEVPAPDSPAAESGPAAPAP